MSARRIASLGPIAGPDEAVARRAAQLLDEKTKPPGSLGRLEWLACRLASIRGAVPTAALAPAIVVAAADHGVVAEGVSAYPQAVTSQMLANFASGGAAVSVLARQAGARLVAVDAGVLDPPPIDGIPSAVVDGVRCTANLAVGPAMSPEVAIGLIERGVALARELADDGVQLIAVGDMGIGNTTSASALCAAMLPADAVDVCGPGTGLDAAGIARKAYVVRRGLSANGLGTDGAVRDPVGVLAAVGGLEIAYLVGVMLGAAERRIPIVLDGFITGAAALVASALEPTTCGCMIAATGSPEPGHRLLLDRLGLEPLLELGLRLGEGSGAALALPLLRSAVAILAEMATFEGAAVSRG
jgi:nicotinate-nucleotide--dimethylbenzimidazole phosphoribosyltransferase